MKKTTMGNGYLYMSIGVLWVSKKGGQENKIKETWGSQNASFACHPEGSVVVLAVADAEDPRGKEAWAPCQVYQEGSWVHQANRVRALGLAVAACVAYVADVEVLVPSCWSWAADAVTSVTSATYVSEVLRSSQEEEEAHPILGGPSSWDEEGYRLEEGSWFDDRCSHSGTAGVPRTRRGRLPIWSPRRRCKCLWECPSEHGGKGRFLGYVDVQHVRYA